MQSPIENYTQKYWQNLRAEHHTLFDQFMISTRHLHFQKLYQSGASARRRLETQPYCESYIP